MVKRRGLTFLGSGAAIVLTAIWGGAYLESLLHHSDWRVGPLLFTSIFTGLCGLVSIGYGVEKST